MPIMQEADCFITVPNPMVHVKMKGDYLRIHFFTVYICLSFFVSKNPLVIEPNNDDSAVVSMADVSPGGAIYRLSQPLE